jgi:predicted component of type VI protein secretion system
MKATYHAPTLAVRLVLSAGGEAERTIPVLGRRFLIGRDPSCQLRPHDRRVSRRHAEIRVEGDAAFLRDLRSVNGTFLNGEAVAVIRPLRDGDRIQTGPYGVTVAIGEAEDSPDRPPSDEASAAWSISPESSTDEPSPASSGGVAPVSASEEGRLRPSESAPAAPAPRLTTREADDLLKAMSIGGPSDQD